MNLSCQQTDTDGVNLICMRSVTFGWFAWFGSLVDRDVWPLDCSGAQTIPRASLLCLTPNQAVHLSVLSIDCFACFSYPPIHFCLLSRLCLHNRQTALLLTLVCVALFG